MRQGLPFGASWAIALSGHVLGLVFFPVLHCESGMVLIPDRRSSPAQRRSFRGSKTSFGPLVDRIRCDHRLLLSLRAKAHRP